MHGPDAKATGDGAPDIRQCTMAAGGVATARVPAPGEGALDEEVLPHGAGAHAGSEPDPPGHGPADHPPPDPRVRSALRRGARGAQVAPHDAAGGDDPAGPRGRDRVASLGVADLPMDAWGVDVVVAGSQKGLMLPPGLALCTLSDKAWDRVKQAKLPRYYFNLLEEKKLVVKNQPHFTPAVSIVIGLREVLAMLKAEGLANIFKRHDRLGGGPPPGGGGRGAAGGAPPPPRP